MVVEVAAGTVVVRGADELDRLHVETALGSRELAAALAGTGVLDGDDVLLDLDGLRARAEPEGGAAQAQRWELMLAGATRAGWMSADGAQVRAHVVRPA